MFVKREKEEVWILLRKWKRSEEKEEEEEVDDWWLEA